MKFTALVLPFLLSTAVTARSTWLNADSQVSIADDDLDVPGENPLKYCSKPDKDILHINYVDLEPNPPEAGKTLTIKAKGNLTQEVKEGAKVHLQVKYGLITLINQESSLCDYVKQVDLECPLKKGETTLKKDVDLPNEIPPGKYTVLADVYTEKKGNKKKSDRITCLTAQVSFHR